MDLKHNSTVVIALAIAVTVVMGMMVPIISDTINSGSSGNSGSPIAPAETITNEGIVYLETMDLNMSPIEIRNGQDDVTVIRDGNTLYTFEKGNESWSLPLNLDMFGGTYGPTIGLFLLTYQVYLMEDSIDKYLQIIYYDYPETHIDRSTYDCIANLEDSGYISIAPGGLSGFQMKVYDSEDQVTSTSDIGGTHIISDKGEYAYARSPTVASDTKLIMCNIDYFNDSKTIQGVTGYLTYWFNAYGVGSVSSWISNIETPQDLLCLTNPAMEWYVGEDSGSFNLNSLEYAINTTETNGGIKVDNVTFTSVWGDANITETDILDKFIVPTTIELPQEGQNQGDYKYKRAESGFTADVYAVNGLLTTDPDDPSKTWDYGKYYDAFPILGDNFVVYVDSDEFGIFANGSMNPYVADYLTINGSTLIAHKEGNPDVSYENLRIFSWKEGDYLLNAAHTDSYDSGHALYPVYLTDDTWFAALVGYSEGVMAQWTATVIGTPDDNSVNMVWYRENAFEEYDHNAEVTMNDENKVTDITLTVDDQDYVFHPDSSTGEYMIFTYVPATIDNGGSGGSDLPPALVSILLAVPLIVLAGLVIMALRMLKLH